VLVVVALLLGGCASSTYEPGCDPALETCACDAQTPCPAGWSCQGGVCVAGIDAGVDVGAPDVGPPIADTGPDTQPRKQFGEPCSDKAECASGICIFAGVGGICSKICTPGSCPPGYGCLGVLDALEQGKVSDVCVPEANQLCTPCTQASECSLSGADLCLDYDGLLFCGRDCTTVACPAGYSCTDVQVSGATYKQCVPDSGACDCDASKTGATKACDITTPFGTCQGSRTCAGAAGWGPCEPPAAQDVPDATFTDDNCDGIDGDITAGIFVSTAVGADGASCGLTWKDPCLTIGQGINRAAAESRTYVYVQAGAYSEVVVLQAGIHVIGGFDSGWKRDARTKANHKVTVTGALDTAEDQYTTVRAHNLAVQTTMADLVLVGASAGGASALGARSSHVVHADTVAHLNLERVTLIAGDGADGAKGPNGIDAPLVNATSVMLGKTGGNGTESFSTCNASTRGAAGAAGTNSCAGSPSPAAGSGGRGGTMDTCCDCLFGACTCVTCDCTATSGEGGQNAAQYSAGSFGAGGGGGAGGGTCGPGYDGGAGRVQNGAGGAPGTGGKLVNGYWYAGSGGTGQLGAHGGGGGGGGGSGGCDSGTDSSGAGGGGGGAGGCAALLGGGGGKGGGGSFALLADASTVTISDCEIQLGNGGNGGEGGVGGRGQSPGAGGPGGLGGSGASDGGDGAPGGHGGHAGGGGGGAGGVAFGVFSHKSNIVQKCTFSGGSPGTGGAGGSSAPTAPTAERDGNPGQTGGDAAPIADVATCADPTSCP